MDLCSSDDSGSGRSKAARPPEAQGEIIKTWNHTFTEMVETEMLTLNVTTGNSGKRNKKFVLYYHLQENRRKGNFQSSH